MPPKKHPNFLSLIPLTGLMLALFSTLINTLISTPAWATLPTHPDDQKPIEITADGLDAQQKKGISIYTGNVIMQQGQTQITGHKATLYHPNNHFQQMIVIGKPAKFKRYLPDEKKWVTGHANQLDYDTQKKIITLTGNAYVNQGEANTISAPKIIYNLTLKTLMAHSTHTDKKRIKMIFTPAPTQTPASTPSPAPTQETP